MTTELQSRSKAKRIKILYWVFTILFAGLMLTSAIPNILSAPEWVTIMEQLGYPKYLLPFLGVAKLLGVIALIVPGFPRIKEWAYAGFFFDLTGVVYSGIALGGFQPEMLYMLVWFGLGILSYVFFHKKLQLNNSSSRLKLT
ncbi:MAG TPA: DoxX family protein [Ferruginibacter sp.]|nr:DoxX family protein [Ferruginibacter sp.]